MSVFFTGSALFGGTCVAGLAVTVVATAPLALLGAGANLVGVKALLFVVLDRSGRLDLAAWLAAEEHRRPHAAGGAAPVTTDDPAGEVRP